VPTLYLRRRLRRRADRDCVLYDLRADQSFTVWRKANPNFGVLLAKYPSFKLCISIALGITAKIALSLSGGASYSFSAIYIQIRASDIGLAEVAEVELRRGSRGRTVFASQTRPNWIARVRTAWPGARLVIAIRHLGRGHLVYQPVIFQGVLPKDERSAAALFCARSASDRPDPCHRPNGRAASTIRLAPADAKP
jgi:hypothetical protein